MVAVAAISILAVILYLLTGGTVLEKKTNLYLYISDATGIGPGSPVRVNGIDVGKVESVMLSGSNNPNRVIRVVLTIEQAHLSDIPVDSYAQISTESAVGDKYVDITRGTTTGYIPAGGEVPFKNQPELLKTLDLAQFEQQLRAVDATLSDIEQGKTPLGQFVQGEEMYNGLRRQLGEVDRAFRQAVDTTTTLGGLLRSDELYQKINAPLLQLDERLSRLQMLPFLREDKQYMDLRGQAAGLRKSIADLRMQPFVVSDELYRGWTKTLTSLIQRVNEMNENPLFSSSETYDNLTGVARKLQESVREFRRDPQKFMRIGLF